MGRGEELEAAMIAEIRGEMAAQGITKQEIAHRVGKAHNTVGRYLRGEREPSYRIIVDLADALGVDHRELLRRAYTRIGVVVPPDDVQQGEPQ